MRTGSKEARKRAVALYEQFCSSGSDFDFSDYESALSSELQDLASQSFADFVSHHASEVDRRATKADQGTQRTLPGFITEGAVALGDNRRIATRFATREHLLASLEIAKKNRDSVDEAYQRKLIEFQKLDPYLGVGVTKIEAIQAYYRDHPEENAA